MCTLVKDESRRRRRTPTPLPKLTKAGFLLIRCLTSYDITANGRALVFGQFDRSESDIMMVENFR
jgi:hypothetical protein